MQLQFTKQAREEYLRIVSVFAELHIFSLCEKILSFENENKSRFILHFAHLFVSLHAEDYTLMLDRAQTIEKLQSSRRTDTY